MRLVGEFEQGREQKIIAIIVLYMYTVLGQYQY